MTSVGDPITILVVDDLAENVRLLCGFVARLGHRYLVASNGRDAVEQFRAHRPELILMDIMMPEMDGIEAAARIRAIAGSTWVPIIFVSALSEVDTMVSAHEAGGDAFIVKPINLRMLHVKLNAFLRIARLQRELTERVSELQHRRDLAKQEQRIASHLMQQIVGHPALNDAAVRFRLHPAQEFSGDLVAAARTPTDTLHVLLADAAGHGLAAAINALPLTQVFYAMTERGYGIAAIAAEMNEKIHTLLPRDRFVSAVLAAIDNRANTVAVWNGGCPDVYFVDDLNRLARTFESRYPPLGIRTREEFQSRPEYFNCETDGTLFLCSDGLPEAMNKSGEIFGFEQIPNLLVKARPHETFDCLFDALDRHLDGQPVHDDVTVMCVRISRGERGEESKHTAPPPAAAIGESDWNIHLRLGAAELRYLDVVPLLFGILEKIEWLYPHLNEVLLIVQELFNNALEHGVLGLGSDLKSGPGGLNTFATLRRDRLETLRSGFIEVRLARRDRDALEIRVTDSGAGFDYTQATTIVAGDGARPYGRGLQLVRSLCSTFEIRGHGNDVIATYPIRRDAASEFDSGNDAGDACGGGSPVRFGN